MKPALLSVVAAEQVGPYTLLRVDRGAVDPGIPGQFFMLTPPGRLLPRPMSLCTAPAGELGFLIDAIGPGTRALCAVRPGDVVPVLGPLGNGFDLGVPRPLLVGGGIGIAPFPYLFEQLERLSGCQPQALLGFRSAWHAEAAALVPNAEVVLEPTFVTEAMPSGHDVLACGPEPMLAAVRETRAGRAARVGGADGLRVRGVLWLRRRDRRPAETTLCGRTGAMRLLNASGCLDALTAPEVARSLDAFVTKTVTPLPREGNAPVRIAETDAGMLNSIGLANPGRVTFLDETLPRLRELGVPLWVSVGGFAAHEYAETCAQVHDVTLELNLSCPNVDEAPESAAEIVAACRAVTTLPLYAKLSPANWDIGEVARAVEAAGADGLTLVNTIRGSALDERTLAPKLGPAVGGYSGPALKPIALAAVYACRRATQLPIVGMGGVMTGRDVLELVAVGANDVALGTVLFRDPDAPARVRAELAAEIAALGVADVDDIRGVAHEGGLRDVATSGRFARIE